VRVGFFRTGHPALPTEEGREIGSEQFFDVANSFGQSLTDLTQQPDKSPECASSAPQNSHNPQKANWGIEAPVASYRQMPAPVSPGLCSSCQHAQPITSDRGSPYVLCAL
jgi:hypothetical protein